MTNIYKGKNHKEKDYVWRYLRGEKHMLFREQLFYGMFPGWWGHSDLYTYYTLFLAMTTKSNIYYFEITLIYYMHY